MASERLQMTWAFESDDISVRAHFETMCAILLVVNIQKGAKTFN